MPSDGLPRKKDAHITVIPLPCGFRTKYFLYREETMPGAPGQTASFGLFLEDG